MFLLVFGDLGIFYQTFVRLHIAMIIVSRNETKNAGITVGLVFVPLAVIVTLIVILVIVAEHLNLLPDCCCWQRKNSKETFSESASDESAHTATFRP